MPKQGEHGISWTDATWNPVRGCSRISPGCQRCYAEDIAKRFSDPGQPFHLFAERGKPSAWTGKVELIEEKLLEPLSWRKPRLVFVNSMSDLFHEALPDEEIDRVFMTMRQAHWITFQVLTKRAARMREYMEHAPLRLGMIEPPNVWLGVSVEDQQRADERIPELLQTPAAVRFVSAEPLLGPVDMKLDAWSLPTNGERRHDLHWVIVGGDSGHGARPFNVQWARDIVAQCKAAGVAVFVKQVGAQVWDRNDRIGDGTPREWPDNTDFDGDSTDDYQGAPMRILLKDKKGGDWSEWPKDLRVREFPVMFQGGGN